MVVNWILNCSTTDRCKQSFGLKVNLIKYRLGSNSFWCHCTYLINGAFESEINVFINYWSVFNYKNDQFYRLLR